MKLKIRNYIINENINIILHRLQQDSKDHMPRQILHEKSNNILITCPYHSNGNEKHPSACVYTLATNPNVTQGTLHCFTCGAKKSLIQLTADCLHISIENAKEWLIYNFGNIYEDSYEYLPEISSMKEEKHYLDESILDQYNQFHPYMYKRKLTDDVIKKFKIGYDNITNSITFPVWDEHDNLVMITKRNVINKIFHLEAGVEKPIYLLNFIKKEHITDVYVVESQIDALNCWSYGCPAIALFGTGNERQYQILNNSGIRHFILCFDGDAAGRDGARKFKQNIKKDIMISELHLPEGKDINDLTRKEFEYLKEVSLKQFTFH